MTDMTNIDMLRRCVPKHAQDVRKAVHYVFVMHGFLRGQDGYGGPPYAPIFVDVPDLSGPDEVENDVRRLATVLGAPVEDLAGQVLDALARGGEPSNIKGQVGFGCGVRGCSWVLCQPAHTQG